jgi:hypothetical protein
MTQSSFCSTRFSLVAVYIAFNKQEMKLPIKKFDCSKLTQFATVMCIGKRGTGKTTLIRDIMSHMAKRLDFGIAMCGTEETARDMGEFVTPSCIYNDFSAEALDVLLKHQKKTIMAGRYKKTFLIMDDTLYDKSTLRSKNMRMLFMNGRHRKIFYLCAVQYLMDIPPDLRSNVDFVFALKENIIGNREKLWKCFFGMFSDYKEFSTVMDECTAGFDCMVLDNTVRSNNVTDCVFWYRADRTIPTYHTGSEGFWKLHSRYGKSSGMSPPAALAAGAATGTAAAPPAPPKPVPQQPLSAAQPDSDEEEEEDEDDEDKSVTGVADQLAEAKELQKRIQGKRAQAAGGKKGGAPSRIDSVEKRDAEGRPIQPQ